MTQHTGRFVPSDRAAPVRVFIVDDSAVVRRALTDILTADPRFEVVAAVADPFAAAERLRRTCRCHRPHRNAPDGWRHLPEKADGAAPSCPVVICSSLVTEKVRNLPGRHGRRRGRDHRNRNLG